MAEIFLSYRRDDTGIICERVALRLAARFGPKSVFRDASAIYVGSDWESVLRSALEDAYVVIALIGPAWAGAPDHFRINEPGDFVRLELATALETGKRVIPVLVNGAHMPQRHELPADLGPLVDIPPLLLQQDLDFDTDMQAIIRACGPSARRRLPYPSLLLMGLFCALSIAIVLVMIVIVPTAELSSNAVSPISTAFILSFWATSLFDMGASIVLVVRALWARAWVWSGLGIAMALGAALIILRLTIFDLPAVDGALIYIYFITSLLTPPLAIAFGRFGPRRMRPYSHQ